MDESGQFPDPVKPVTSSRQEQAAAVVGALGEVEEQVLRLLDELGRKGADRRWLVTARTHIEQGFMAAQRAINVAARVKIDPAPNTEHGQ